MADIDLPDIGQTTWGGPLNTAITAVNADVETRAPDDGVVHKTGAEAIAGLKTFANGIAVPAASLPISAIDGLASALGAVEGVAGDAVISVNGQTGTVVLDAADVSALPDDATFDDLADGATNVAFTTANRAKLADIESGATSGETDAYLLDRAHHTGTQTSSTISDLAESIRDTIGATLVQGTGVTISVNDGANTITISASGGGGGGSLYARDDVTYTTGSLAADDTETSVVALGPSYLISRVEVDTPARVRLYATTAQRDADEGRATGTLPTVTSVNHGLILDVVIDAPGHLDITPAIPGVTVGGGNAPLTVTNLDSSTSAVLVTLTSQRTED